MKRIFLAASLILTGSAVVAADGGGMGGGRMMAGSGMMVVADDGSLLVANMEMHAMMGGGSMPTADRELVNIESNGTERWRASFEEGWPMMPVTDDDLVVVILLDDWFVESGRMGDGGWSGGMGGGMGGGKSHAGGPGDGESILVALDLATGRELWRATVTGDMVSMAQFSPDGSRIYLSVMEMRSGGGMGSGSMRQGDTAGAG